MADDIARLGFEVDSGQTIKAAADLKKLAMAAIEAEAAAKKLKTAASGPQGQFFSAKEIGAAQQRLAQWNRTTDMAAAGNGRFAHSMTNVSFQVQDFAVQVASGQSALMAFAQQFPQLTGALGFAGNAGLYGALIGTAAAIGVALYGALAKTEDKAKTFKDAVDGLDESMSAYIDYVNTATTSTADLTDKFGAWAGQIRGFSEYMAQVSIGESLEQSQVVIDGLSASLKTVVDDLNRVREAESYLASISQSEQPSLWMNAKDALDLYRGSLEESAAAMGILPDQAERLYQLMQDVKSADSMGDMADKAAIALSYMKAIVPEGYNLPKPLREAAAELESMAKRGAEANEEFKKMGGFLVVADGAAQAVAGSVDAISASAAGAADAVAGLALSLWDVAKAKAASASGQNTRAAGLAEQYRQYGEGRATVGQAEDMLGGLYGDFSLYGKPKKGGGGGGGGEKDRFAEDLQRLQESLMTERETVDAWYAENQTILNDRRALEIMGEQAHKDALLDLETEYQERLRGIKDAGDQYGLQSSADYFSELYSLSGSKYEGLLRVQKAFAAASALVNTYQAASQALADPTLTYWQKFAAVAKVLAAGFGFVNAIKSGGSSSGGGGGGSGGATTSATRPAADTAPTKTTRIELMGDDWIINLVEPVLDQVFKESKNGTRVIWDRA